MEVLTPALLRKLLQTDQLTIQPTDRPGHRKVTLPWNNIGVGDMFYYCYLFWKAALSSSETRHLLKLAKINILLEQCTNCLKQANEHKNMYYLHSFFFTKLPELMINTDVMSCMQAQQMSVRVTHLWSRAGSVSVFCIVMLLMFWALLASLCCSVNSISSTFISSS